jgi:ComF family protein
VPHRHLQSDAELSQGPLRIARALRESLREGYSGRDLRADVMGGVVVGIVALPLAMALARLLCDMRGAQLKQLSADIVIPIPMYWARRLRQGANGPELIAEVVSAKLGLPLRAGWLKRRKLTPRQTHLTRRERRIRQRNSFSLSRLADIGGRTILLIDDVLTSGATTSEAAKVLLKVGAKEVNVAVIARAIGEDMP